MTSLMALVLTTSVSFAEVKEVGGLAGNDIPIQVVAPKVKVKVTCAASDKAKANLQPAQGANLTLTSETLTAPKKGAKFTVSGTGGGNLLIDIPKHIKLTLTGVSKKLEISGCDGNVTASGAISEFVVDTPGANVNLTISKGGFTKPSEIKKAVDISVNMPDISAKITGTGISVNMPDVAPQSGSTPVTITHSYGAGTPDMKLTATQNVVVTRP